VKLLLDTNVLLWSAEYPEKLSVSAQQAITNGDNHIYISSVSLWEICQKISTGKLFLDRPADRLLDFVAQKMNAISIGFEMADCVHLTALPPIHKDPFDRMLICQTIEKNLTFVTNDRMIRQYPIRTLW
jgi:PIN domain nuclease of toxin-antitoxin system